MKFVLLMEKAIKLAPRIAKGVKDVAAISKGFKKNREEDSEDFPKGVLDAPRATATVTVIIAILYAVAEMLQKVLEVL
jgi:hypothetical protein